MKYSILFNNFLKPIVIFSLLIIYGSLHPTITLGATEIEFAWVKGIGGVLSDFGLSTAVDPQGNIYTTGSFSGTADFGSGNNLTSIGDRDIFISKFDRNGNFVWAKSIGGTSSDRGTCIDLDSQGNIYITGSFEDSVDFDPGAGSQVLTSAGNEDIFIGKYDPSGNLIWVIGIGSTSGDHGYGIDLDSSGNVYTTGIFHNTADFNPGPPVANLTSTGGSDIFIIRLTGSGSFGWAKSLGGSSTDIPHSIALDSSNNVIITGQFEGTVNFDPGGGIPDITSAGAEDIFINKISSAGDFIWVNTMGNSSTNIGKSIVVDPSDNVYVTGDFENTVDFNPGAGTTSLTSAGGYDVFICKFGGDGSFTWAKNMGGSSSDYAEDIAVDSMGNVYTTGEFWQTGDFDPGPGTAILTGTNEDVFISKLNTNSNFVWAKSVGGTNGDYGKSIFVDSAGSVYITGDYKEAADFDPGPETSNLVSAGAEDIFIVKLVYVNLSDDFFWPMFLPAILQRR